MSMADQVILLNAGRIEQDAPPAELYARPASVFAARFIGTPPMNIVAAPGPARAEARRAARSTCAWSRAAASPAACTSAEYLGADTVVTCTTSAGASIAETIAARLPGATSSPKARRCGSAGPTPTATCSTPRAGCAFATPPPFPFPPEPIPGGDPRMRKALFPIALAAARWRSPCLPRRRRSPR
jgi:hypothetical protein